MSNPLFDIMQGKNPLQMFNNIMLNANPQDMMLKTLQQQNPNAYNQLQNLMNSGADPQVVLNQMLLQLTPQQKQQLEQLAKQFGVK